LGLLMTLHATEHTPDGHRVVDRRERTGCSGVCVVVTVLEAHFVGVLVGVRVVTVRMVVYHVIVLVLVVGMVMDLLTMRVLVVMRCSVFVFLAHFLVFLSCFGST
jgi:hypothetical protein